MSPFSAPFIVPSILTHTHTLILLHPLGSTGHDFGLDLLSVTDSTNRTLQTTLPSTKFIFPTATAQCVTARGGARMPQWFDAFSTHDPSEREALQYKGLREGCTHVHALIDGERGRGVPVGNIVLGGVGMGAAMALWAMLTHGEAGAEVRLGGCAGMGGWLALRGKVEGVGGGEEGVGMLLRREIGLTGGGGSGVSYKDTPVFLGHRVADEEVPVAVARDAAKVLRGLGFDITLKMYGGSCHAWTSSDEINHLASFLAACGLQ